MGKTEVRCGTSLVFCRKVKVIVVEAMTAVLTCAALVGSGAVGTLDDHSRSTSDWSEVCIDEDLCWLSEGPQATASR